MVVVAAALNLASTAAAAPRCVTAGWVPGGAQGLLVLRSGESVDLSDRTCMVLSHVVGAGGLTAVTVLGAGWQGTLRTRETRVDGLVNAHGLTAPTLKGGGHANLPKLAARLERTRKNAMRQIGRASCRERVYSSV